MAPHTIRPIRVEGNIAYVTLTKGHEAVIDASDAALLASWNWRAEEKYHPNGSLRTVYAVRDWRSAGKKGVIWMHRVVARTPAGLETDHIDGDGLNNRRENLRPATTAQNQQNARKQINNTSGNRGVSYRKDRGKWQAFVSVAGKQQHVGMFDSLEAAVAAHQRAAAQAYGEFAPRHQREGAAQ